jgi:isopropylmalate/homocitrate/citramalate synthase
MLDAWTEISMDAEAISIATDHGLEDGHDGHISMAYETAPDYIRDAYEKAYKAGRREIRRIREEVAEAADPEGFDGIPDLETLAKQYGINTDDGEEVAA